jgi:peptidoglycan LD-endopeptidase LytH
MKTRNKLLLAIPGLVIIGFLLPQNLRMPVEGATHEDYNPDTYWYYPWGKSVTHKGVDIFAKAGTKLYPATNGLIVYSGHMHLGGNVILILGPRWRFHYYAHLQRSGVKSFTWVTKNKVVGYVGSSGNAAGKPPHLHYSIVTPIPYVWRIDHSKQGWKKMFYLNPVDYLNKIN